MAAKLKPHELLNDLIADTSAEEVDALILGRTIKVSADFKAKTGLGKDGGHGQIFVSVLDLLQAVSGGKLVVAANAKRSDAVTAFSAK